MPALSRRSCSLPLHRGSEHRRSPFRRECFPRCFILGIRYFSVVWRVAVIATSCEDKRPLQSIRPVRLDHVLTLAPFPPPAPPPPRRSLLSLVPIHSFALLTACFRTSIAILVKCRSRRPPPPPFLAPASRCSRATPQFHAPALAIYPTFCASPLPTFFL